LRGAAGIGAEIILADIFISYSQGSPEATQELALDLTSKDYTVWFDSRLLPMDVFWKVIRDEIKASKAVIVIWSPRAVDSEWVYAEAKMAHEMKKLICVRTPDVQAFDVPMPFNGYNVTPVGERAKIYEALTKIGLTAGKSAPLARVEREVTEVTVAWGEDKASGSIKVLEAFIAHYRDRHPFFAVLAETKLAELTARSGRGAVFGSASITEEPDTLKAAGTVGEIPLPQAGDVFLRIEPGMHTAMINRIGVNAAGTLMVTGSDDKTARLWALPESGPGEAKLLRTLRVPIGDGNDGKVYAVALSPDGKWVAAGGPGVDGDGYIYIFEFTTGRIVTRFNGASNHLAFSPDSTHLAGALARGEGMRLWETAGWQLLAEDKDYGGQGSYGATFDSANRLYTVADDGQIRRYGADGHLEAREHSQGGKMPFGVAVHPQGGKIAIGFHDTTAVEVYDARTLKRLYAADTTGISGGSLSSVAWCVNGALLYAGGRGYKVQGKNPVVFWQAEGRGVRSEVPLSQATVIQLLPCRGGIAAGTADPAFGLIAADGAKRVWQEGVTGDMRDKKREAFTLSANGKRVRFGLGYGGEWPVLFDLASFRPTEVPQGVTGLAAPNISGIAVSDWEDCGFPKLNGKLIELDQYEGGRSLAIAPDASRFVLGTEWWLRAYRADGGEIWKKAIPSVAWGVNISGNGKLLAAAYGDGTIRWHRLSDGEELLALFVHAKDRRYIAWTPKGYYAASHGAEDLIGWHVNRGFDAAPDFYPASTFASTFNRPDIVKAALDI
jgi:WD40 repeat protein